MKFLREPLLHFVLLGAGLFAGYHFLNRAPQAGPQYDTRPVPTIAAYALAAMLVMSLYAKFAPRNAEGMAVPMNRA